MKKIILLACMAISWAACQESTSQKQIFSSSPKQSDWEKEKLKGKVQSVEEWKYDAVEKDGKVAKTGEGRIVKHIVFDKEGYYQQYTQHQYTYDGIEFSLRKYLYDNQGNLIEIDKYDGYDTNRLDAKIKYQYDEQGNNIEEAEYDFKGNVKNKKIWQYEYTEKGYQKIETTEYYYKEGKGSRLEDRYLYNAEGKLIAQSSYNQEGILLDKETYQYDAQGKLIANHFYTDKGELKKMKRIYQYNEQGKLIDKSYYDNNDEVQDKETWQYDAQGNMVERVYYDNIIGRYEKEIWQYDAQGNQVEYEFHIAEGNFVVKPNGEIEIPREILTVTKYMYQNDEQGNWVKEIYYFENELVYVIDRNIVYF